MYRLVFIILIFLFAKCANQERNSQTQAYFNTKKLTIKSDDVLFKIIKPLSLNYFKSKATSSFKLQKTTLRNDHDTTVNDTIYSYMNEQDTVDFFKGIENEFLISFIIQSQSIQIGKNIKIGMTEKEIFNKLNMNELAVDTISIETKDETLSTIELNLIFHNKTLRKIDFISFLDLKKKSWCIAYTQ